MRFSANVSTGTAKAKPSFVCPHQIVYEWSVQELLDLLHESVQLVVRGFLLQLLQQLPVTRQGVHADASVTQVVQHIPEYGIQKHV